MEKHLSLFREDCQARLSRRKEAFYIFAIQGPAFGAVSGDVVLEKANKLKESYEPAKDMELELVRPSMWSARAQAGVNSGVISVSYTMQQYEAEIRRHLTREGFTDAEIGKGIELSGQNELQLTNPMSGVFVMGVPMLREKAPTQEKAKGSAPAPASPADAGPKFPPFTGTGVCDVCNAPLAGKKAYIVPNPVFYRSKKYREHVRNVNAVMAALTGNSMDDAYFETQLQRDRSPGSAVCEDCIHMFE